MMTLLKRFETGFTLLTILFYSGALYMLLGVGLSTDDPTYSSGEPDSSSPALLLMQITILLVLFGLVALRWKRVLHAAMQVPLCWLLPLLAVVSTEWSVVPDLSLRRGIVLVSSTLLGVYWAVRYPLATQLRLLAWGVSLIAILCLIFTLVFPSFAIETGDHAGAWRGLFVQKNGLARMMVLGGLPCLCLVLHRDRLRLLWWTGLLITTVLLLLSTSKTGVVMLLTLLVCVPLFRALRTRSSRGFLCLLLGFLVASCVGLIVIENTEAILTSLGRDVTLTGRTGIWDVLVQKILARPWFGYGYKGFWLGMNGESADIWYATFFMAPNGHNGYLDLSLDLGLVGLCMFLTSCAFTIARAIAWLRQPSPLMIAAYPLLFLTYLLLYNTTESSLILEPNSLFWALYVAVATTVQIQAAGSPEPSIVNPVLEEVHHG